MGKYKPNRFDWLKRHLAEPQDTYSLFELGCYDCHSLRHIPKPKRYVGADAGVSGGIEDARMTFNNAPWVELVMAHSVQDIGHFSGQLFDYSIALNTLEYIPDAVLKGYIQLLAKITKKKLLVTVPVEIGVVLLAKEMKKIMVGAEKEPYTLAEIYWAVRGQTEKIQRFEHKGFDYRKLIALLNEHFTIVAVEGIPLRNAPMLSAEVGIVAEPRERNKK